jgi:hypothetical protein
MSQKIKKPPANYAVKNELVCRGLPYFGQPKYN